MYCPMCATQNIDSAKFCRSCGANLSLVPQALSGRLTEASPGKSEKPKKRVRQRREPNLGRGIRTSFMGLAFLMVVAALFLTRSPGGFGEIWLLIPAFLLSGKGIAEIVTVLSAANAA
ncbi:MAG: zinc ribbon domain-containing protein [Acidobacteriota bacterium]